MIPTNKEIHKKLSRQQIEYVLLNNKTYFADADRFINLHEKFTPETIIGKVSLWIDMIVSPLVSIIQFLFFGKKFDIFTVVSIHKTISIWLDWFQWKELQTTIREWIRIIRSIGGPFIGCNDAKYHMYVYADGMQRVHDTLLPRHLVVSKEGTKRL